jgi:YbbR domain-containing protein
MVAVAMWLLNKLTERYTTEVAVTVQYVNLPANKAPIIALPQQLYITVRAGGVDIIKQLKLQSPKPLIDYEKHANHRHYIPTDELISYLEVQLENIIIIDIRPDTIRFAFDDFKTRRIPIKVSADIETAAHFNLKDVKATNPDSVDVSGAAALIDTLSYWQTETLTMRDVSQSAKGDIALVSPNNLISLSSNSTQYEVNVEEYTEKSLSIPIQVVNLPKNTKIFLYPNTATVYFQVGTDNFEHIDEGYFKVEADFNNYDIANNNYIDIAISNAPHQIRNMRVEPLTVEYIIME